MGVSRSAAVVLGHLMTRHKFTFRRALKHVKRVRHIVLPNPGFLRELHDLDVKLHGSASIPLHMIPVTSPHY